MSQPNILLLLSDQHRPDFLTINSDIPVRNPNIANLAAQGMNFTNAVCASPTCAPSRACLASGKSYHRAGVPSNQFNYPLDQPTFYGALRDNGYHVAAVGKFDLHKPEFAWGLDGTHLLNEWGFSEGVDSEGKIDAIRAVTGAWPVGYASFYQRKGGRIGEYMSKILADYPYKDCAPEAKAAGPYTAYLQSNGLLDTHVQDIWFRHPYTSTAPTPLPEHAYGDTWIANQGLALLENFAADKPWFLQVNFAGPHDPVDVTEAMHKRWWDVDFAPPVDSTEFDAATHNEIRRNYAAMIENIDTQVGRYLDLLAARGELENTIVIYASDHGEMLGDHNLWMKSVPYHPSISVPLVISGPGIAQNVVSEALVSLHDLAATFLDYAGLAVPEAMDSVSLQPVLSGEQVAHRDVVFSSLLDWDAVYNGRFKFIQYQDGRTLLFDLREDPHETNNLAEQQPELCSQMAQAISEMKKKS
ncbi:MAG: sulfatase-like hydrolase/transferase [Ardenticatenaceae bacterium]|nr:sulfatase-like hydrolase/transferase [Ardenticatenaceae bacterium]